jgi:hypothetical protein
VVDVVVGLAEVLIFFFGRGKAHGSNAFHVVAKHGAHGKPCITFHLQKVVEEIHQVFDMQAKGFGGLNGINKINVRLLLHKAAGRIDPFVFGRKIFADFFAVFNEVHPHQPFLYKVAVGANVPGMVKECALGKGLNGEPGSQFLLQCIVERDVFFEVVEYFGGVCDGLVGLVEELK